MVPCILVDREGLGNEWLLNVCGVVTVMAKKLVVSPGVQTTNSSHHVLVPEREPGWLDIIASKWNPALKLFGCLATNSVYLCSVYFTHSHKSTDWSQPWMVCTSFFFVLDHCNVGRIDRDSGSRSMDHGRISREGWQWKLSMYFCLSVSSILVQPVAQSKLDHIVFFNVQAK